MVGMAASHLSQNRTAIGLVLSKTVGLNQPRLLSNPLARSFATAQAAQAKVKQDCPITYLGRLIKHGRVKPPPFATANQPPSRCPSFARFQSGLNQTHPFILAGWGQPRPAYRLNPNSYQSSSSSSPDNQQHQHDSHSSHYQHARPRHRTGSRYCPPRKLNLLDFGQIDPKYYWGRFRRHRQNVQPEPNPNSRFHSAWTKAHAKHRAHHRAHYRCHRRRRPRFSPEEWIARGVNIWRAKTGVALFTIKYLPGGCKPKYNKAAMVLPRLCELANGQAKETSRFELRPWTRHSRAWSDKPAFATVARRSVRTGPLPQASMAHVAAPQPGAFIRSFSSTRSSGDQSCQAVMQAGIPIFLPLMAVLKSSAALNVIGVASRIALTLLPLSLRGKFIYTIKERIRNDPNPSAWLQRIAACAPDRGAAGASSAFSRFNAIFLAPGLALLPFALLAIIVLASLERTPVTGRVRVLMVSPAEEAELVKGILATGESQAGSTQRDWVQILKTSLELPDEGVSPTTGRRMLLGGEVLDERDWRVRWTKAVLSALEAGVSTLAYDGATTMGDGQDILHAPPTAYPLKSRTTTAAAECLGWKAKTMLAKHAEGGADHEPKLAADYDLLVIDRAESNSFAFGFGPDEIDASPDSKGTRGVIVVYTGFIDEILGRTAAPVVQAPALSAHSSFLGGLFAGAGRKQPAQPALTNLEPDVLPTSEQTRAMAVLLSHELAHLVLSHTLEAYASTSLLVPHLSKLTSDVLRTLLFPITAILGPFVNDAVGRSLGAGALGSWGALGAAVNSCESRKLETEADLVALRLLANSGIDPRIALQFWAGRVGKEEGGVQGEGHEAHAHSHAVLRPHSAGKGEANASALTRTHPVDEERVRAIRNELREWARWQGVAMA